MFTDSSFILGNARVVDHPIVFANDGFCKITGYNRAEVMQQSSMLRFMWGESTDAESCKKMEEAFQKQEMLQVELLLVKKTSECLHPSATSNGSMFILCAEGPDLILVDIMITNREMFI